MRKRLRIKKEVRYLTITILFIMLLVVIGIFLAGIISKRFETIQNDPRYQTENYYETSKKMTEKNMSNQSNETRK